LDRATTTFNSQRPRSQFLRNEETVTDDWPPACHMENRHIFNVLMAIRTVIGRSYGSSDGFLYGFSLFRAL